MEEKVSGENGPFFRILEHSTRWLICMASAFLLLMMAFVAANVIGRYFFKTPMPGIMDIVGFLGALLIAFSLAPSENMRRTLSISILVDRLPERAQVIFNLVGLALGTAILAVLTWTGASYAWEMWVEHELADVFEWPIAPFRFAWAFGCLLFLIVLVARLVVEVRKTVDVWSR